MDKRILIKYTSKGRAELFFRGLNSIYDNLAQPDLCFVLATFDVDDEQYRTTGFAEVLEQYPNLEYYFGISSNKVDSINRDLPFAPKWDIIVNFSDDMIFTKKMFDDIIRQDMPEDLDAVLNFKDVNNDGILMTLSIIGKKYFDRFGWIYNPIYISTFCDMEYQEVAKRLGKLINCDEIIYNHLHPIFNTAPMDDLYEKNMRHDRHDRELYFKRLSNNFGL